MDKSRDARDALLLISHWPNHPTMGYCGYASRPKKSGGVNTVDTGSYSNPGQKGYLIRGPLGMPPVLDNRHW